MLEKGASTAKILSEVDLEGKNLASSLAGSFEESLQEIPADSKAADNGAPAEPKED